MPSARSPRKPDIPRRLDLDSPSSARAARAFAAVVAAALIALPAAQARFLQAAPTARAASERVDSSDALPSRASRAEGRAVVSPY